MSIYKKSILSVLFSILILISFGKRLEFNAPVVFLNATNLYEDNKYEDAIIEYEKLISYSYQSENLYYNLANAYYKNEMLGKSILYYEKTLKINPNNDSAFYNLSIANTKIKNPQNVLPDLFFVSWWKKLIFLFSTNSWAWIAISFSWFSLIAFAFYLFSSNSIFKKASLLKAFIFGFISILSFLISGIVADKIFSKNELILVQKSVFSKDAPSKNAKDVVEFFEGSKFDLLDKVDDFYKIKTPEGITVWVNEADFIII